MIRAALYGMIERCRGVLLSSLHLSIIPYHVGNLQPLHLHPHSIRDTYICHKYYPLYLTKAAIIDYPFSIPALISKWQRIWLRTWLILCTTMKWSPGNTTRPKGLQMRNSPAYEIQKFQNFGSKLTIQLTIDRCFHATWLRN